MGYNAKDVRYWKYRMKAIDCNDVSAWTGKGILPWQLIICLAYPHIA